RLQTRLNNRAFSRVDQRDLDLLRLDAGYRMTHLCQACCRDTANVSHAKNCDIHKSFLSRMTTGRFESRAFRQASVKPGYFSRRRVPKQSPVLAVYVIEERPVMAHRVLHRADGPFVETQIVGMHIQQRHTAMLSDPV